MPAPTLTPPPQEQRPTDPGRTACFAVLAEPDPASLPRVLELFAKRGLVPSSVQSRLFEPDETLHIDVQVPTLTRDESDYIARCLRAIPLVRQVLTSERHRALAEPQALIA
jgi:acetolactate synthase small subunit